MFGSGGGIKSERIKKGLLSDGRYKTGRVVEDWETMERQMHIFTEDFPDFTAAMTHVFNHWTI